MVNKTVIIFGAGATASIGFPATGTQDHLLKTFFFSNSVQQFLQNEKVQKAKISKQLAGELFSLKQATSINYRMDFPALCEYVKTFFSEDSFTVMNLFNLLDLQRQSWFTFGRGNSDGNPYPPFYPEQLEHIRRALVVLIASLIGDAMKHAQQDNSLARYKNFFKQLAIMVRQEKMKQLCNGISSVASDFIMSDLTYISLNWDPVILWAMFIAHKELNDCNCMYWPHNKGNAKLKIFNDFAIPLAAEPIENKPNGAKRWYPYSEAVAQRVNDPEHLLDRIVTLIRTLFPHGQTNWLLCPKCGKVSMFLGNQWDLNSTTLPMELPVAEKSICKEDMRDNAGKGNYQCVHCGFSLSLADTAMLMQTVNKEKPSFIEEIQTDMRLRIAEAERIIFVGYSLPSDDFEYRSIFAGLNGKETGCSKDGAHGADVCKKEYEGTVKKKKVYVLLHESGMPNEWFTTDDMKRMLKERGHKEEAERFSSLFNSFADLQFNFAGFPNGDQKILELM